MIIYLSLLWFYSQRFSLSFESSKFGQLLREITKKAAETFWDEKQFQLMEPVFLSSLTVADLV